MPQPGESVGAMGAEATPRSPVWPMVPGVVAAALALEFIVSWMRRGTMPRFALVVLAALLMFTAVMVCGVVVRWVYAGVLPGGRRLTAPIVRAACLTALWVPAWVLFIETWSVLMLVAGCVCLASLGIFLKRCEVESATDAPHRDERAAVPFQMELGDAFQRMILPSLVLALAIEASVALAAARWFMSASLALGLCAAVAGWRWAARSRMDTKAAVSRSRQMMIVTAAFIATVIALIPYLKVSPFTGGLGALRGKTGTNGAAKPEARGSDSNDGYVGIILLAPSEQHKAVSLPVKREFTTFAGVRLTQALEIPFDGAYWYFKYPDKAPRPTAKVVRGDAAKVSVRSTDRYPLLMEAHQKLDEPIDLGCCSAIDVVVKNNDKREGAVVLELWVRKRGQPATALHYLGTVTVPSSEQPLAMRGTDVPEESLRFPVPPAMDGIEFDEMTVAMRGVPSRAQFGAQVGLRKFVLEP